MDAQANPKTRHKAQLLDVRETLSSGHCRSLRTEESAPVRVEAKSILENGLRCTYSNRRKKSRSESGERRFHGRCPCVQLRRAILLRVKQAVWLEPR